MNAKEEREMHALAVQLAVLTEGEGWEAMRYAAIGKTMDKLAAYSAVGVYWQNINTAPVGQFVLIALISEGVVRRVSEARAVVGLGWYDKSGQPCRGWTHWSLMPEVK